MMMSPKVHDSLEAIFRGVGLGLAVEMAWRSAAVLLAAPREDTVFQVVAGWSIPFVLGGSMLILLGHAITVETAWRHGLAMAGHALGFMWAFAFAASLLIGSIAGTNTGIVTPIFLGLAALHGCYFYICGRRVKWTRKVSR